MREVHQIEDTRLIIGTTARSLSHDGMRFYGTAKRTAVITAGFSASETHTTKHSRLASLLVRVSLCATTSASAAKSNSHANTRGSSIVTYRVQSELPPVTPLRLKIEINTREHFQVFGVERRAFAVETR